MKLKDLIKGIEIQAFKGEPEIEVYRISYDSRKTKKGDLFVCISGSKDDGHNYIQQARDRGVVAFLVSREVSVGAKEAVVVVSEPRLVMGKLASRLAGEPSEKMEVIGVTGTNGKTTVSYLIESISQAEGKECGVIGTINYRWKGNQLIASNTTPESVEIIELLKQMANSGVKRVAMEISSHALDQKRVGGIRLRAGIFTNLSWEHLDYHKDMEDYFQAKAKLFSEVLAGKWTSSRIDFEPISVINLDDDYGRRLFEKAVGRKIGYGINNSKALYQGKIIEASWQGIKLQVNSPRGEFQLDSALPGKINAYNILSASSLLLELGASPEKVIEGVASLKQIPGRMERIENDRGFWALVDYAHTPDALENTLRIVQELKINRLILVFGCGGDRDRAKRPRMGEIGAREADLVIITSDNPRSEEPIKIIDEIEAGVKKIGIKKLNQRSGKEKGYLLEPNRSKAIELALESAEKGDCVLIAGKGHEDYQIIGSEKIHLDDREEVRNWFKGRG